MNFVGLDVNKAFPEPGTHIERQAGANTRRQLLQRSLQQQLRPPLLQLPPRTHPHLCQLSLSMYNGTGHQPDRADPRRAVVDGAQAEADAVASR
jgi:hypothetical protein